MSTKGTWNLSELYADHDDPKIELDMQLAEQRVDAFVERVRQLIDQLSNPSVLRQALDDYADLCRTTGTGDGPGYYAALARAMNSGDANFKSLEASLDKRITAMDKKIVFFVLAIGKIPAEDQLALLEAPELTDYRTWLEVRFENAAYDLPDEVNLALQDILPQAKSSWSALTSELLSNAKGRVVIDGNSKTLPFNQLSAYMTSTNVNLVRDADNARTGIARRYATVAEHEINAVITTLTHMSKLKGHSRVDEASFLRNGLTAEIVESMLSTVEAHYDISHDFYALKARLLGRSSIHYYERGISYGSLPSGYSFDHAATLLRQVLVDLHPDFVALFDQALAEGKIDYAPRQGKRGGAACWHNLITQPTYLMLNYTGQLHDIQTLAHEFGHFLNNLHMQSGGRCNSLTFGAPTSLAEVSSTFFEKYILDATLKDTDDETRLAILMSSLDSDIQKIYRQAAATRFEQALYAEIEAKGYLSKRQIGELFIEHMAAYLGSAVELDAGADIGWIHWMHFRSGFYNYSYVFAQLVSSALQDKVDADASYIDEFRRLMETGRSQRTVDLLSSLQLNAEDGSVWRPGLEKIREKLTQATELATKLGVI